MTFKILSATFCKMASIRSRWILLSLKVRSFNINSNSLIVESMPAGNVDNCYTIIAQRKYVVDAALLYILVMPFERLHQWKFAV